MWALISNGQVRETTDVDPAERFHEDLLWEPVPSGLAVNQTWSFASGAFVPPTPEAAPTLAEQAAAAIANGLTIVCTSAPALSGTYAVDAPATLQINAVTSYILVNGKFPGSSSTYPWFDRAGAPHLFPSVAEFQKFATAVADYVADLALLQITGAGTLPPSTTTIT